MIPLAEPNLSGKEQEYVADAISSGWVGPDGPYVERFEEMVAKAAGRKWAVATTTGTMALLVAFQVTKQAGQMAYVPRAAFPAAANMYRLLGCSITYIGAGVDHDTQHYGPVCDRAPAIGEPGTTAVLECYSFAANKIVTCGHGGAVVGDDRLLLADLRRTVVNGVEGGNNGRMANINAAVGCAQMERLDEFKEKKRQIWERYAAAGLPMMERGASRWMATVEADDFCSQYFDVGALEDEDIEFRRERCHGVSIPCSTTLTEAQQDKVIKACESLL